jgi:hypothetical protein
VTSKEGDDPDGMGTDVMDDLAKTNLRKLHNKIKSEPGKPGSTWDTPCTTFLKVCGLKWIWVNNLAHGTPHGSTDEA